MNSIYIGIIGVIIGGIIGVLGVLIGQVVSHKLTLKREKEKREYEESLKKKEKKILESKEFKKELLEPIKEKGIYFNPITGELELGESIVEKGILNIPNDGYACFLPHSKILMSNNLLKSIENIKVGDLIQGYSSNQIIEQCEVVNISKSKCKKYVIINKELGLTESEMLFTYDGFKRVSDIDTYDFILNRDGHYVEIANVERRNEETVMFNLHIGMSGFFVENFLVGGNDMKNSCN